MKYINLINEIIEKIKMDYKENATYEIDTNLTIKRLNKKEMLNYGNFIYGIQKEGKGEILLDLIFFIENNLGNEKIHLGKWKNPNTNKIIIELIRFGENLESTLKIAEEYKQYSIYDIKNNKEIILDFENYKNKFKNEK